MKDLRRWVSTMEEVNFSEWATTVVAVTKEDI